MIKKQFINLELLISEPNESIYLGFRQINFTS